LTLIKTLFSSWIYVCDKRRTKRDNLIGAIINLLLPLMSLSLQILCFRLQMRSKVVQVVERRTVCTPLNINITSGISLWSFFWNTLHYHCKLYWIVTIADTTQCILLHYYSQYTVYILWINLYKLSKL
jgi:hypothetical protein